MTNEDYMNKNAEMHADLIKFISETKDVHADSVNPFHKSKYASLAAHLAALKPLAAKHNLAIVQLPESDGNNVGVRTTIVHKNGMTMSSFIGIPMAPGAKGQDAGALISYLRRYALASVSGVATDDDDAEGDRVAKTTGKFIPNPAAAPATTSATPKTQASTDGDPVVPFGKNKGSKLSELDDYNLDYWANKWEPKPWEKTGKVGPKDLALKAAAVKLWNDRQSKGDAVEDAIDDVLGDEVPF
jgi:hypothetical protein